MPVTFLLLQTFNILLACATLYIRFRDPLLWDDQAIVLSTSFGTIGASLTAILLGMHLAFGDDTKWGPVILNLGLTLAVAGMQGYFLYLTGKDLGLIEILKAKLGSGL